MRIGNLTLLLAAATVSHYRFIDQWCGAVCHFQNCRTWCTSRMTTSSSTTCSILWIGATGRPTSASTPTASFDLPYPIIDYYRFLLALVVFLYSEKMLHNNTVIEILVQYQIALLEFFCRRVGVFGSEFARVGNW